MSSKKNWGDGQGGNSTDSPEPQKIGDFLPLRTLLTILITIFAIEYLFMAVRHFLNIQEFWIDLLDPLVLIVIILPVVHFLIYRPMRLVVNMRNNSIAQLKMTQNKLERSLAFGQVLLQNAQNGFIAINGEGTIMLWNRAAESIFGYAAEEVVGKNVLLIVPDKYKQAHSEGLEKLRKTGTVGDMVGKAVELSGLRQNGEEFPIELGVGAALQEGGNWWAVGSVKDLSRQKEMERNTRRHERLASLGTLSAGLVHEILNPVNVISTTAQNLRIEAADPAIKEITDILLLQVKRISELATSIRSFALGLKEEPGTADIHSMLDSVLESMLKDFDANHVEITKNYCDGPGAVAPMSLVKVLSVSIHNALDAMKPHGRGTLAVTTSRSKGLMEISISDDGVGIPLELQEKIFDPFFTTKNPGEGVGLGLSIANTVAKDLGGTISVKSELGKGACFMITLPMGDGGSKGKA